MEIVVTHKIEAPELCSALREIAAALKGTGGIAQPAATAEKQKRGGKPAGDPVAPVMDGALEASDMRKADEVAENASQPEPAPAPAPKDNTKLYAQVFDLAKAAMKTHKDVLKEKLKELDCAALPDLKDDPNKLSYFHEWLKSIAG